MKKIPSIVVPIVEKENIYSKNLFEILANKKVIIFGVPGAFTPTCSEKHLPGFLKLSDKIKNKGVDDIFCMSVNDKYVMQSWLLSYSNGYKVKGIADGNGQVSMLLDVLIDNSLYFMGFRCKRFAMIVENNTVKNTFFEESGGFENTAAENILKYL